MSRISTLQSHAHAGAAGWNPEIPPNAYTVFSGSLEKPRYSTREPTIMRPFYNHSTSSVSYLAVDVLNKQSLIIIVNFDAHNSNLRFCDRRKLMIDHLFCIWVDIEISASLWSTSKCVHFKVAFTATKDAPNQKQRSSSALLSAFECVALHRNRTPPSH